MSERRQPPTFLVATLVMLLLIPLAYMGTYYGMLSGTVYLADDSAVSISDIYMGPEYRFENGLLRFALEPAHQVDRLLRPDHWRLRPLDYQDIGAIRYP